MDMDGRVQDQTPGTSLALPELHRYLFGTPCAFTGTFFQNLDIVTLVPVHGTQPLVGFFLLLRGQKRYCYLLHGNLIFCDNTQILLQGSTPQGTVCPSTSRGRGRETSEKHDSSFTLGRLIQWPQPVYYLCLCLQSSSHWVLDVTWWKPQGQLLPIYWENIRMTRIHAVLRSSLHILSS